jgi:hypothetical protein
MLWVIFALLDPDPIRIHSTAEDDFLYSLVEFFTTIYIRVLVSYI